MHFICYHHYYSCLYIFLALPSLLTFLIYLVAFYTCTIYKHLKHNDNNDDVYERDDPYMYLRWVQACTVAATQGISRCGQDIVDRNTWFIVLMALLKNLHVEGKRR